MSSLAINANGYSLTRAHQALNTANITALQKLLLYTIASIADRAGKCKASLAEIATHMGCSERTARKYFKELVELGFLTVVAGERRTSTTYLNLDKLKSCEKLKPPKPSWQTAPPSPEELQAIRGDAK